MENKKEDRLLKECGIRVRYYEARKNYFISYNRYLSRNNTSFEIHLDMEAMIFKIKRIKDNRIVYESKSYKHKNSLKRAARAKLVRFGVPLKKEVRDRSFGRVEKGFTQQKWRELNNLTTV